MESRQENINRIFLGEVGSVHNYGAFVSIPGQRKQGLIHRSQVSKVLVDDVTDVLQKGERVWCKIINVTDDGKIGLSMKVVDQGSGKDLDPNGVQINQDDRRRKAYSSSSGKKAIVLDAVLNTTCAKCGTKGHMAKDCFTGSSGKTYELIPEEEELVQENNSDVQQLNNKKQTKKAQEIKEKKNKKRKKDHKHKKKSKKTKKYSSSTSISSLSSSLSSSSDSSEETGTTEKVMIQNAGQGIKNKELFAAPEVAKRKASANIEFMKVCQRALESSSSETTEYEAVGINVGKKLEKMYTSQAIYVESLINIILSKGLLIQLTPNTVISENLQNNTLVGMNTYYSNPSSNSSTSNYSSVDPHIQSNPTAGNSQSGNIA